VKAETMTNDHDGYHEEMEAHAALVREMEAYRALVRAIGAGFHPDTRVGDYSPPLPADLAARYEATVDAAFAVCDPYAVAIEVFEEIQRSEEERSS
jgi:hypothetical protein